MSFFSWFSAKPTAVKSVPANNSADRVGTAKAAVPATQAVVPAKLAGVVSGGASASANANSNVLSVERKVKRQVRREQLYSAIRESMTRAGLLSASYKFKVLSLDQKGNQFLVMMDVAPELATGAEKLSQTEALLIQTANVIYNITVTAVYWRTDHKAAAKTVAAPVSAVPVQAPVPAPAPAFASASYSAEDAFAKTQANPLATLLGAQAAATDRAVVAAQSETKSGSQSGLNPAASPEANPVATAGTTSTAKPGHDPLLEAEVAAFKRALAAPAQTPTSAALQAAYEADRADKSDKSRTGLRSYTLITGFEDTEMPDSPAIPALSNTQYGDLR